MKHLLKYILSLTILFGIVPISGQEAVTKTCSTVEVKQCCQVTLSDNGDVKKKKKKGKKKVNKGKKKKKGFFSKVFGSK